MNTFCNLVIKLRKNRIIEKYYDGVIIFVEFL